MLKQGTFIKKQFNKFLLGNIFGSLAYAINLMVDSIVSGSQLGETALEAVSIVYPMVSVVGFFACLLPTGISVLFGKFIGEFKPKDAHRAAGTGLIAAALLSVVLCLGMWLIKMPFLNYFECTDELLRQASIYYDWLIVYAFISPIGEMLYNLVVMDGETVLFSVSEILGIAENIILSFVLSRIFGIAGLGIATAIYAVTTAGVYVVHLLKKSCNVKFEFCLDFKIIKKALVLSSSDYLYFFYLAAVDIILNRIILTYCGMEYIPAYSVVNLVFCTCEVFLAIDNASMGLVTCFFGEKNNHDLSLLLRYVYASICMIALVLTLVFFFGASLVPLIYGLETPVTVQASVFASRVMAFACLGFGACYVGGGVASDVEKPLLACFISFLNDVFCPLLLSLAFGALWGFKGIVIGMCLSGYFAVGLYALVTIARKGIKGFPIYVKDFGFTATSYDLYVNQKSLEELRHAVGKDLKANGFEVKDINQLIEEFFQRVMEKNPNRKVLAECTLLFHTDKVRIIIRDNGVLFNFEKDVKKDESREGEKINNLLKKTKKKNYVLTDSFNRNGFVFEKQVAPAN